MFVWTEALATGNKFIDEQHKEIFRRADDVLQMTTDVINHEQVISTFKFLVSYVFEHFSSEEKLMQSHNYVDYESHKQAHANFIKKIARINTNLKEYGVTPEFIEELKMLIIELLVEHIDELDKKFASTIRKENLV